MGKFQDLTGKKFGLLTVIGFYEKRNKHQFWKCICDCGNEKIIQQSHLKSGHTRSCGCLHKKSIIDTSKKHGKCHTKLYFVWHTMKQRCYNLNNNQYKNYGKRGIGICSEWLEDFISFYNWAINNGYKEGLSLDRIDNNGNYEPNNCRWATVKEQSRNRRNNRCFEYNGKTQCLEDWAKEYNLSRGTLNYRLLSNWSIEKALTTPLKKKQIG